MLILLSKEKTFLNKSKSKDSIAITAMKTRKPVIIMMHLRIQDVIMNPLKVRYLFNHNFTDFRH